jgi:hydroxyacylglutathione hydrolase
MSRKVASGEVVLVDVRNQGEWNEGHIEQAQHQFLGRLPQTAKDLPHNRPILVQCRSGARSAVGASVLQAAGYKDVINLTGGIMAWTEAGLPVVAEECSTASCG